MIKFGKLENNACNSVDEWVMSAHMKKHALRAEDQLTE
jgi:hypothetical protein